MHELLKQKKNVAWAHTDSIMQGQSPPPSVATLVGLADASSYLSGRGEIISKCPAPSKPMPPISPIAMAVDFSRFQVQTRSTKSCRDPRGWNIDRTVESEIYPVAAIGVADYRPVMREFGRDTRLDFRPPYQGSRY